MKKNMKVFEIKAIAANGNDRTVHAVVTLDVTLADACKMNNIPIFGRASRGTLGESSRSVRGWRGHGKNYPTGGLAS